MRQPFEQQLARGEELPRVIGMESYLRENAGPQEIDELYERFFWEVRRGKDPEEALQAARFVNAFHTHEEISREDALKHIWQKTHRSPLSVGEGQNISPQEGLHILNFTNNKIQISKDDIQRVTSALGADHHLTVVVDDHLPSASKKDGNLIWNVSSRADLTEEAWQAVEDQLPADSLPEWLARWGEIRPLLANGGDELVSEHAARAARTRQLVEEVLLSNAYGPSPEELSYLEEEEADWALDQLDRFFEHYTQDPRLALHCQSLNDFSPLADWQKHGPASQRALLGAVTGDSPLVAAALSSVGRLRMGSLAFTGDPDHNGDDLLSAVLPAQECAVILRPEALARTLFLAGMPSPDNKLPSPHATHGTYSTFAVGHDVVDMLRTRAYLCLTPASEESIRDYFQGRTHEITLEDTTSNQAFQALVTAVMLRRKQGEDSPLITSALRVAAAHAIYVGLSRDPDLDPIAGIHLGGLGLGDIEQVVVTLRTSDEWHTYHHSGKLPSWLRSSEKFFAEHGIRLRARAPLGHGSMAVAT